MNDTQRQKNRPPAQPSGDVYAVLDIMAPLLAAAADPDMRALGAAITHQEAIGVFAWAVRSGYLGWTRTHPNAVLTPAQIQRWHMQARRSPVHGNALRYDAHVKTVRARQASIWADGQN